MLLLTYIVSHCLEGRLLDLFDLANSRPSPANHRNLLATARSWFALELNTSKSLVIERKFRIDPDHGNIMAAEQLKLGMPLHLDDKEPGLLPAAEKIVATGYILFRLFMVRHSFNAVGRSEQEFIRNYHAYTEVLVVSFGVGTDGDDIRIARAVRIRLCLHHRCARLWGVDNCSWGVGNRILAG